MDESDLILESYCFNVLLKIWEIEWGELYSKLLKFYGFYVLEH